MDDHLQAIDALSYEMRKFPPSAQFVRDASTNDQSLYQEAQLDHEGFWEPGLHLFCSHYLISAPAQPEA